MKIIYQDGENIFVLHPTGELDLPLEELGRKDVPPLITFEDTGEVESFNTWEWDEETQTERKITRSIPIMRAVEMPRPFFIVADDAVPKTREGRAAWKPDFSTPAGHGIGGVVWWNEQAGLLGRAEAQEQPGEDRT